jgi:chemotaxis methyl-accepting protein methylase
MTLRPANHAAAPDEIQAILEFVRTARGFDAAGYCLAVLATCVQSRLAATGVAGDGEYLRLLATAPAELDLLVAALTIKFSSFFRDPLAFDYLHESLLPALLTEKAAAGDGGLRVWSAGCAHGEEPYSLAILLHDLARHYPAAAEAILFATDRDEPALALARTAIYPAASLANVRHGLLATAFAPEGESFRVLPAIAGRVRFSVHDLLNRRSAAPAESVFGSFDLILCRNVLIYFEPSYQSFICEQLYRALAAGGCLLLGRTETLPSPWSRRLRRVTDCCALYRKSERTRAVTENAGGGVTP